MTSAEITRERNPSTPADLAFELAISWRDYQLVKHHYRDIAQTKIELDREKAALASGRADLLGLEADIGEALSLQRTATEKRITAFAKLSRDQRKTLAPEKRLECEYILLAWEREQELAARTYDNIKEQGHDRER